MQPPPPTPNQSVARQSCRKTSNPQVSQTKNATTPPTSNCFVAPGLLSEEQPRSKIALGATPPPAFTHCEKRNVRLALRARARPSPISRPNREPRRHRIIFDVPADSLELVRIPHPMVVRLGLPKVFVDAAKNLIAMARADAFNSRHHPSYRHNRRDQHMHVIWHHHIRVELIMSEP